MITHGLAETVGDGLRRLARVAAESGVELVLPPVEVRKHRPRDLPCGWSEQERSSADLAVVLGGDGTTLRGMHRFLGTPTPVFAVNYGTVGFLTTAPADELEPALRRAFAGDFQVVELPALELLIGGECLGLAVNDVVVTSGLHGRMARFSWRVDGIEMGEIGCDAIVLATPSGSTAYSLSAGGPVMAWGLDCFGVSFVAPHSLSARSLILPRGNEVEIENRARGVEARVVLDGQMRRRVLAPGDTVSVRLARQTARLALLPEVSFLGRYRDTFAR